MSGRIKRTAQLRLRPGPRRPHRSWPAMSRRILALTQLWLLLCLAGQSRLQAQLPAAPAASQPPSNAGAPYLDPLIYLQRADGTLRSLTRDQDGQWWAVGDRGIILTSDNAGEWFAEPSGTSHPLSAIAFANDRGRPTSGWAVGGWYEPFSGASRGLVLKKTGRQSDWNVLAAPDGLPRLTGIQPINDQVLIAWGDWSTAWDASLFTSLDGGRSWRPMRLPIGPIHAAHWLGPSSGLVLDTAGQLWRVEAPDRVERCNLGRPDDQPARHIVRSSSGWWVAGDGPLAHYSPDGSNWQTAQIASGGEPISSGLPTRITAAAADGDAAWLASWPEGRLWRLASPSSPPEAFPITTRLPPRSLAVTSDGEPMVAGAAGSIYRFRRQTASWEQLHGPAENWSVVHIVAEPAAIDWPSLVQAAWEEQQAAAILILGPPPPRPADPSFDDPTPRLEYAISQLGLSQIDYLHVDRSPAWQSSSGALAGWLRVHQPRVVVTGSLSEGAPHEQRAHQHVLEAVRLAADPSFRPLGKRFPAADEPYRVPKLMVRTDGAGADLHTHPHMLLPRSGQSMGDLLGPLAALGLAIGHQPGDDSERGYRSLGVWPGSHARGKLWLSGVGLEATGNRGSQLGRLSNLSQLQQAVRGRQSWEQLGSAAGPRRGQDPVWSQQLERLLKETPSRHQPQRLWELAQTSRQAGHWNRWYLALRRLTELPADPQTPTVHGAQRAAWQQLIQLTGSVEVQVVRLTGATLGAPPRPPKDLLGLSQPAGPPPPRVTVAGGTPVVSADFPVVSPWQQRDEPMVGSTVEPASAQLPEVATDPRGITQHLRHYWELADTMTEAADNQLPGFAFGLPIRLGQAARARQQAATGAGEARTASGQTMLESIIGVSAAPSWKALAQAELTLARQSTKRSGSYLLCRRSNAPPLLDGLLAEEMWHTRAPTLTLGSSDPSAHPLTRLWLAYDDRFLYVAVDCQSSIAAMHGDPQAATQQLGGGASTAAPISPTASHLPDRIGPDVDHWRLRLDIDRDYQTWFELSVDEQRRIADRLCDMPGWNPRWAVAHRQNRTGWQTEAAIPLSELTLSPPTTGSAWAISFDRQLPPPPLDRAEIASTSGNGSWNHRPKPVVQGVDASLQLLLFE
jgi:hypothetical protein